MLEMNAIASCDRCSVVVEMQDVEGRDEAYKRLHKTGWCEDEDGNDVCEQCWAKFDARAVAPLPTQEPT